MIAGTEGNGGMAQEQSDRTLTEKAYRVLRHDIVCGALPPRAKLKLEELCSRYDVGHAPLREALARLVGEFLVVAEGQRGFWVAPLSLEELRSVNRLRAMIEVDALQDSIRLGDEAWEREVRASFTALASLEQDILQRGAHLEPLFDEWETCNERFHSALIAACGSPTFLNVRATLYRRAERYRRVARTFDRDVHEEHVSLFEATIDRNVLRACRLTENHIAGRLSGILRHAGEHTDWQ
ncbi:FCD domain-containing protein [Microbacteriaceae bacterium K1510]|nr:FCD domain-containing protein [Microbacteriaceae bacterium K1510]